MVPAGEIELKQLMLAGLDGDAVAFRRLLDEISRLLRGFLIGKLNRIGRGAAEAEDVLQEVLLVVYTRRHTYDVSEPFRPWLYAIARYKLIDYLRRSGGSAVNIPLDDFKELTAREDHAAVESRHDLHLLLDKLPDKMRRPIQCVKLDGLSVAEAAVRCGLTEAAVKTNVHRGLKMLALAVRENKS